MDFKRTENKLCNHVYFRSDEFEITVADDGVYVEGLGGEPDDATKSGYIKNYQDLQDFAYALGDAWKIFEDRQLARRIQVTGAMPPPPETL